MRFVLVVVVLLVLQITAEANEMEKQVENALAKYQQGDTNGFCCKDYKEPGKAALAFAKQISSIPNADTRDSLIGFVISLELNNVGTKYLGPRSENSELVGILVNIVESDTSWNVRETVARNLREWFLPKVLDEYASNIKNAAMKWKQRAILLLYGVLPSNRSEDVLTFIRGIKDMPEDEGYILDWLLARYGDRDAEKRLLATAESSTEWVKVVRAFDALAYVASPEVKKVLAKGLRSEIVIKHPGGSTIPKRDYYAKALVIMMRDDNEFPVKTTEQFFYSDEQLDQIEKWCTHYLGIQFPEKHRKKIHPVPHIAP